VAVSGRVEHRRQRLALLVIRWGPLLDRGDHLSHQPLVSQYRTESGRLRVVIGTGPCHLGQSGTPDRVIG
jgi:hypothetical protein